MAVSWLAQGSTAMEAVSRGDNLLSISKAAMEDIDNFKWTSGVTRAGSWQFLVGVHIVYAIALNLLSFVMKGIPDRVSWAKPLSKAHNVLMASLSLAMLLGLVYGGLVHG